MVRRKGSAHGLFSARRPHWALFSLLTLAVLGGASRSRAEDVQVAVASNFASTLTRLSKLFEGATGHHLVQSSAASGQLFAQIQHGAPFQVFLSADTERPRELEKLGLVAPGSRFVYAEGRLVLWSPTAGRVDAKGAVLQRPDLGRVALADPKSAPYGAAAERLLRARGLWDRLLAAGKLALGTSITQAHQFVATGNADVGFVALSQVRAEDGGMAGSAWIVPKDQAGPILQEAVLLKSAATAPGARAFLHFLRSHPEARRVITQAGYEVPKAP
jgi:molybdate transport system substrate-binding protein